MSTNRDSSVLAEEAGGSGGTSTQQSAASAVHARVGSHEQGLGDADPKRKSIALLRVLYSFVILFTEYLLLYLTLAHGLDGSALKAAPEVFRAAFWYATLGVAVACASITATLVFFAAKVRTELAVATAQLTTPRARWLAVHIIAFAVLVGVTYRVLSQPAMAATTTATLFILWLISGLLSAWAVVKTFFGDTLLFVVRKLAPTAGASLLVGAAISLIATRFLPLWDSLTPLTLRLSTALLDVMGNDDVFADPSTHIVGVRDFIVKIEPTCSGIEGIALLVMFMSGYLVLNRAQLRFPRALVILPLGAGLAWFANGLRIALLIALGAHVDREIAKGGFHSMAGWLFFCALTVGLVFVCEHSALLSSQPDASDGRGDSILAAYLAPLLALLSTAMLTSAVTNQLDVLYPLRLLSAGAVLYAYRRSYKPPKLAQLVKPVPLALGVVTFGIWLALPPETTGAAVSDYETRLMQLSPFARGAWLSCRVAGTVIIVPIVEELAFRGFLQRRFFARDFASVPQNRFGWLSILVSALVFGLLHANWLAGMIAGMIFSVCTYLRGRLSDAIVAHATTNALLTVWVLYTSQWEFW